ncbi:hypothetical protein HHI36_005217 [Cryptolaemus montrouzieri]|uniref:Uncharacterized protein n=1 Tax=Cryptolaemus montrouzieri TaxID=559131 RepID=A0ABD2NTV2_9CUCU
MSFEMYVVFICEIHNKYAIFAFILTSLLMKDIKTVFNVDFENIRFLRYVGSFCYHGTWATVYLNQRIITGIAIVNSQNHNFQFNSIFLPSKMCVFAQRPMLRIRHRRSVEE